MVPCPWFVDFAEHSKSHPDLDVGIHITLTSEWDYYKFGGVLPSTEIPSLLDENGYFYPTTEEVGQHADPVEAEKEYVLVDRFFMLDVDGPDASWEEEYGKMRFGWSPGRRSAP